MKKTVIGIDIGGTNTVIGLVTQAGEVIAQKHLVTNAQLDFDAYVTDIAGKIQELQAENVDCAVLGIGIGAPDGNFLTGSIEHAVNLLWKGIVPIVKKVEAATGLKTALTNDANAAVLGELLFGGAIGAEHILMVTLGTGLGGGVIVDGKLLYGKSGHAGELGHVNLVPDGRVCGCGARGCVETYVSATGLVRTTVELMSEYMINSPLRSIPVNELTSKTIFDAAMNEDYIAREAFRRTSDYLGRAFVDMVTTFSPEKIFVFGGLAKAGEYLLEPAREVYEERVMPMYKGHTKIELSALPDGDAAVLGAAALIWDTIGHQVV